MTVTSLDDLEDDLGNPFKDAAPCDLSFSPAAVSDSSMTVVAVDDADVAAVDTSVLDL